jgi:DNA replication protein DnaC
MMVDTVCCDGTGWYKKDVPFGHPDWGKLFRCECGRSGDPEARMHALHDALRAYGECRFDNWLESRAVEPTTWGGVTYDANAQLKALRIATKRAKTYADDPEGMLFIFGSFGAGKTHLAASIGFACAQRNLRVQYYNITKLVSTLRQAAGDFDVEAMMRPLLAADVLILDDIGAEEGMSPFIQSQIYRLIDERLDQATVVTSNLDLASLGDKVGGRIHSRLQLAQTIWLPVSDYRKHK